MKLKSLKFVLPVLLVLPSLALAYSVDYTFEFPPSQNMFDYIRTIYVPKGSRINKVCLIAKSSSPMYIYLAKVDKTEGRYYYDPFTWSEPVGTCRDVDIQEEEKLWIKPTDLPYYFTLTFRIFYYSIGDTRDWLSSNEILAHIGKLAEDIPDYIALMIGLPIAFWFIEKTITFVRGNFRPVEKIKEE
jgi:hypothetical protein